MKTLPRWSIGLIVVAILAGVLGVVSQFAQKSMVYAAGTLSIEPELAAKANGIRTVFVIVFDAESPVPMPYGAARFALGDDVAAGDFMNFALTPEVLRVMNPDRPRPKQLRLKARLDRDGQAGPDQPGDLTGELDGVAFGQEGLKLAITHHVE